MSAFSVLFRQNAPWSIIAHFCLVPPRRIYRAAERSTIARIVSAHLTYRKVRSIKRYSAFFQEPIYNEKGEKSVMEMLGFTYVI